MRREVGSETGMVDSVKIYTFDIEGHTIVSQEDRDAPRDAVYIENSNEV